MRTPTIKKGLSGLRDSDFSVRVHHIYNSMNGNTNYITPSPTLPVILAGITAYDTALADQKANGPEGTTEKKFRKKKLKDLLDTLFIYVMLTGAGDILILQSSGFPLAQEPQPVGDMPKPVNFKVVQGDGAGEVHQSIKKVTGANSYVFQYKDVTVTDTGEWISLMSTKSRLTINGIEAGKKYSFRVAAVGAKGQGPWSDIITRFVS